MDSNDPAILKDLGERLAEAFKRRAAHWPALVPTDPEACEITTRTSMARLEHCFTNQTGQVWNGLGWRVIWEHHQTLAPSPLFRTVVLKPVPRHLIAETLLPWRTVLQSNLPPFACANREHHERFEILIQRLNKHLLDQIRHLPRRWLISARLELSRHFAEDLRNLSALGFTFTGLMPTQYSQGWFALFHRGAEPRHFELHCPHMQTLHDDLQRIGNTLSSNAAQDSACSAA